MLTSAAISALIIANGAIVPRLPEKELNCLAQNIYHEARGESEYGQMAVTHVVMNRVSSKDFPNTPCQVIKQARYRNGQIIRNACQFSWYCDGEVDVNPKNPTNKEAWEKSVQVAIDSYLLYYLGVDMSKGAINYHATYVTPKWSRTMKKTAHIGYHVFYRRKGDKSYNQNLMSTRTLAFLQIVHTKKN